MFRKIWERIKHPRGLVLIAFYIFTAICIAGAVIFSVFLQDTSYYFVAYVLYGLAALSLAYTVYTIIIFVPQLKKKITEKLKSNKFASNVLENYDFKTTVFAVLSFALTVAFATMNLVGAILYKLVWYGAIAAYYFVLILFRGGVLYANKKCADKFAVGGDEYEKCRWRIYLASGAFLILLEAAMMGAVTQMMLSERPAQSGEIMAISTAAYTFYKVIMAIYNLIKARKHSNPVTQSLRNLNFADACMSVVSITVLMISTFDSAEPTTEMSILKCTVGFAVCAVIIAMAAFMIIRANKKLKCLKEEYTNEQ